MTHLRRLALTRAFSPLAVLTVVGCVVAVAILSRPDSGRATRTAVPPLTVSATAARFTSSYEVVRRVIGRVEAGRRSQVGFEVVGPLDEIRLDEGDQVDAGLPLASLDTGLLVARRNELLAAQQRVTANLALARSTFDRTKRALAQEAVSEQDFDEAEQAVATLEAEALGITAQIATVDVRIKKSTIYAPFDAVVARRLADEGQVLAIGTPVLELLERSSAEAGSPCPPDPGSPTWSWVTP